MEPTFRYSLVQRLLHWAMALVIFIAIGLCVSAATVQAGTPQRVALLNPHEG
jgi:cytochrome b561